MKIISVVKGIPLQIWERGDSVMLLKPHGQRHVGLSSCLVDGSCSVDGRLRRVDGNEILNDRLDIVVLVFLLDKDNT